MKYHLLFLILSFLSFVLQTYAGNSCDENFLQNAAWGLSSSGADRFLEDATLEGNRGLSDGEIYDRLKADIERRYEKGRISSSFVTPHSLALKIRWAAECTGNDFSMLAGVIKTESIYCYDLHNEGGGDSGCGQFTGAPIGIF